MFQYKCAIQGPQYAWFKTIWQVIKPLYTGFFSPQ